MRDFKPFLLILLSVLLLISTGLLFTALYHFYYKTPVQFSVAKQGPEENKINLKKTTDSLLKIYTETVRDLERGFDSTLNNADSLKKDLKRKLSEFYELQKDIKNVLDNPNSNKDLGIARQKIIGLQERVAALHYTNLDAEKENKRLNALLKQLTDDEKIAKQNPANEVIEKVQPAKNNSRPDVFSLHELRFSAIQISDDREQETNDTDLAEKFSGSFKVKNNYIQNSNVEIMLVVLQPDGKVMYNSDWDAGTFETTDGKKIYSGKLRFDYFRGEEKQLRFSLTADRFQQGNYTLKVYHNGILIGKTVKNLS